MSLPETTTIKPITFTQNAAEAVRAVIAEKNLPGYALRLFISGGGCSGYQYGLALDNRIRAEDMVTEMDGIKLIVDEVSIKYLQGATVDYVDGPEQAGFAIINPNPIAACSCSQNSAEDANSSGCASCGE